MDGWMERVKGRKEVNRKPNGRVVGQRRGGGGGAPKSEKVRTGEGGGKRAGAP